MLERNKEYLVSTWYFNLNAFNRMFSNKLPYPSLKVYLKDIMEQSLPMDKQAQAKLIPWKEINKSKKKEELFPEHSNISIRLLKELQASILWCMSPCSNSTTKISLTYSQATGKINFNCIKIRIKVST